MDKFCDECDSRLQPEYKPGKGFFKTCSCGKTYGRVTRIVDVSNAASGLDHDPYVYVMSSLFPKTFLFCDACSAETENTIVTEDFDKQKMVYLCHPCVLAARGK